MSEPNRLCLLCSTSVTAKWLNWPQAKVDAIPEAALLCVEHLGRLLKARGARRPPKIWPKCGCGNAILLATDLNGQARTVCQRCLMGLPKIAPPEAPIQAIVGKYETPSGPAPSCYGLGGQCPREGRRFAGGRYCEEHSPAIEDWMKR